MSDQISMHISFLDLLHAVSDNQAPHDWHEARAAKAARAERWFKQVGNYPRWMQWRDTRLYHESEADRLTALRQKDLI